MRKWLPLTAICLGTFMLLVDVTIVNVALPQMALDLHTSFGSLQWVLDIYALALAALLMTAGAVADRFGRRRGYLFGLAVFAGASLACGLAPNAGLLIAARAVQGIGGAAMFATTTALLSTTYRGRDRGVAFGIWGAVAGAAAAAGPLAGGLLTQHLDWRWIFLVNLPVAVVAAVLTLRVIPESRTETGARVDLLGAGAFTVCASAVTYALIRAGDKGWTSASTLGLFGLGAVALAAFVVVEQRREAPMLDLALLRDPAFATLIVAALLLNAAAFAQLVFTSLWLQSARGLSPVMAGLTGSAPLSLVAFVVAGVGGRFLHRFPARLPIGGGLLLVGTGALLQTAVSAGSSWPALLAGELVTGLGVGMALPIMASTVLSAVPHERAGMAGGALNAFRQIGFALGIAVLGTVFASRLQQSVSSDGSFADPHGIAQALTGGQAHAVIAGAPTARRAAVEHAVRAAFAAGLDRVYLISGVVALVAGVLVLALVRPRRAAPVFVRDHAGLVRDTSSETATPA